MTKTKLIFATALALLTACANDDTTRNEQQGADNIPAGATLFSGETNPADGTTRTAIVNHTKGGGAKVNWSTGDQIWVKDNGGTWRQSGAASFPVATNKSYAKFALNGTYNNPTHQVVYTNLPIASIAQVEIKSEQTQSTTNNFDHAGVSGDCGIATASGGDSKYSFTLEHKAAYLCIYPRIENNLLHKNVKIEQIVITSTSGPIAGKYDFSTGSLGAMPISSASNSITLTTTSGEISLDTRIDTCYYVVIAPGNHTLKVEYYINDPDSHVSAVISKDLGTISCAAGKMADITAWIDKDITYYPNAGHNYYMWDAQQNFWAGYEWDSANPQQPILRNGFSSYAPSSPTDPRYANMTPASLSYGTRYDATTPLFKTLPNANEMLWYIQRGNPLYDAGKLWSAMGHLYKGGTWMKKKAKISGFSDSVTPDGTDLRTTPGTGNTTASTGTPTAANIADYFFLPNFGYYLSGGSFYLIGVYGHYWSSSSSPQGNGTGYNLRLEGTSIDLQYEKELKNGFFVMPFE